MATDQSNGNNHEDEFQEPPKKRRRIRNRKSKNKVEKNEDTNIKSIDENEMNGFPDPSMIIKLNKQLELKEEHNKEERKSKKRNNKLKKKKNKGKVDDIETFSNDSFNESESEDEYGKLLSTMLDIQTQNAIKALRTNDPKIYDANVDFTKTKCINENENENEIEKKKEKEIANQVGNGNDDNRENLKYEWVPQCSNETDDQFLKNFFEKQFYRIKDENELKSKEKEIAVYRNYSGIEHDLDDVDLSEDDERILDANDFERQFQEKQNQLTEQMLHQQHTGNTTEQDQIAQFLQSDSDAD